MHRFWENIIRPCFDILQPKRLVEIGMDEGLCTQHMLQYCKDVDATLHIIDPKPQCDIHMLQNTYGAIFTFHKDISLNALYRIPSYDAVLIDGDHNWYTVFHELLLIEKKSREQNYFPIVFLHDTGWPYGRRDLYYDPCNIPPIFCQPHRQMGVSPEESEPVSAGGVNQNLFHAIYEHNVKNGVLTAIEDFLDQTKATVDFTHIPGLHGLGIIIPRSFLRKNKAAKTFFSNLHIGAHITKHIETLEESYLHYTISLQKKKEEQSLQQEIARVRGELANTRGELANTRGELANTRGELANTRGELANTQKNLEHMQCSRSWRWTSCLRNGEAFSKKIIEKSIYTTVSVLHDLWMDFGEPFPHLARYVRHMLLGKKWPSRSLPISLNLPLPPSLPIPTPIPNPTPITSAPNEDPHVAVIITSHNDSSSLSTTIEHILSQTFKPTEILIIDEVSSDDTKEMALRYAPREVEYLRGTWKNTAAARNAGLKSTKAPFLVFFDNEYHIPPDYLASGIAVLTTQNCAAIAYPNEVSDSSLATRCVPDLFDPDYFERVNYLSNASIIRRRALMQVGGWVTGIQKDPEWLTFRRIIANGWKAVKIPGTVLRNNTISAKTPISATTEYALSLKENSSTPSPVSSPHGRGNSLLETTLCLSLSGRTWMWALTKEFLEKQTYPHNQTHLVIIDTSQDTAFGNMVREWLRICDYGKHTYLPLSVGIKGLADLPRRTVKREVASACTLIYNSFIPFFTTSWIFFLEDDVIPPMDVYPRLLQHFSEKTVSVSALCLQRMHTHPIAWEWDKEGMPVAIPEKKSGVTAVGGNGFCCAVLRGEYVQATTFRFGPFDLSHDHNFYRPLVHGQGLNALIDWSCVCRHYLSPHEWT